MTFHGDSRQPLAEFAKSLRNPITVSELKTLEMILKARILSAVRVKAERRVAKSVNLLGNTQGAFHSKTPAP